MKMSGLIRRTGVKPADSLSAGHRVFSSLRQTEQATGVRRVTTPAPVILFRGGSTKSFCTFQKSFLEQPCCLRSTRSNYE